MIHTIFQSVEFIGNSTVTAMEIIPLKPGIDRAQAFVAAQEYDDVLDGNAHSAAGYVDHAHFFFSSGSDGVPASLILIYQWENVGSLLALLQSEDLLLNTWMSKWADGKRFVRPLTELNIEV